LPERLAGLVALSVLLVAIWALTGAGYFWPIWPILGVGLGVLKHQGRWHVGHAGPHPRGSA
jgi:hypothetical protein